jgi:4-amino-4-deoxy-L-arabinose transferase-like glycosyltransferase
MALPGFLLAAVALVATAVAASSALRLRSLPSFLLAVYLLASAELVVLGEALSLLGRAGAVGYAACEALLLAAAVATWEVRGRPPPPLPALDLRAAMRRHPILTALGIVVGGALGYQLFIAVGTPPNNWDSMSYHLPRAVEWLQRGGVTYVPGAATERMNALQPVGELEILWTLAFLGTDAAAALPQLLAELASLLATYAIARRIGFGRPDAAFASLLAATLTQVALQSVTSQNDLVAASFVVAAAALILGRSGSDVALAGLALALALGTKLTSAYALPVLVALALVTLSRRRLAECAAAAATAFLLVGSYGYVLNRVETGRLLGDRSVTDPYRPAQVTLEGTASTVARIGFRFFDLSALHPKSEVPEAISAAGRHIFDTLGIPANPAETSVEPRFDFAVGQAASEDISYFGPLGVLLVLPLSIGFAVVSITRREQWQRLALALALPVTVLEIALTYRYNIWLGRFLIMPVLLTMPLAAVLYRRPLAAAAAAVVGAVTLVAAHAFNVAKPTGLEGTRPVWSLPRPEAQALTRPGIEDALVAVDRRVPENARVGIVGLEEWSYPVYGRKLDRRLVPLPHAHPLAAAERLGLRWVVDGTAEDGPGSSRGWRTVRFANSGWTLFKLR